ncbi:MAG: ribonuclease P protein component [Candidatus Komeilibacteria bacterium RIFCSPLOWO2_01_FULL_52_15]|uniref:Ribonuclease P protein component n=2 Tax=Candidatus Komeiliibacteriota TaxID=1817908 RepID=A0A1G2BPM8_9BACT|nr:MAG: ribonuclease P protein component [Candidatus Komeilibacteria bacterium RIFCSPHIGHO2_01_FULL_52_14]OGY91051.1 MAG: ribonuclease P protein component [Candidatus Komeilibacteria bacterium RIFCSPLOWO2_01_FULL_52_15]
MLPRDHRLRGDQQFKKLARYGRSFFGSAVHLKMVQSGQQQTRFAFVVSTKISKRAVVRNTIRRRMREIIRKELPQLKSGFDVLLIARPKAATLEYWELQGQIVELLNKARLFSS